MHNIARYHGFIAVFVVMCLASAGFSHFDSPDLATGTKMRLESRI
ncbi:MAG: hypothetical protein V1844_08080 [Pseudomonadota bacterium]